MTFFNIVNIQLAYKLLFCLSHNFKPIMNLKNFLIIILKQNHRIEYNHKNKIKMLIYVSLSESRTKTIYDIFKERSWKDKVSKTHPQERIIN